MIGRKSSLVLLLAAILCGGPLEAQLPFWPFRRRTPPQLPARPAGDPFPAAGRDPAVPERAPEHQGTAVLHPGPGRPESAPVLSPLELQQADERRRALRDARARELAADTTASDAEARLVAWGMVLAIDPDEPEGTAGHDRARRDLRAARGRAEEGRRREGEAERLRAIREALGASESALRGGDIGGAERAARALLGREPGEPGALAMLERVNAARRRADQRRRLLLGGSASLLAGAGALFLALRALRRPRAPGREAPAPAARLQVVAGVGRGRMATIEVDLFRVGALELDGSGAESVLLVSDEARRISRIHCTILRRGRRWWVTDCSLNGTGLNGIRIPAGGHRRLRDGDEILLADASRLLFLVC